MKSSSDHYKYMSNKITQQHVLCSMSSWSNYYKLSLMMEKVLYLHKLTVGNESLAFDSKTAQMFTTIEDELMQDMRGVSSAFIRKPNVSKFLIDPSKIQDMLTEEIPQFVEKIKEDTSVYMKTVNDSNVLSTVKKTENTLDTFIKSPNVTQMEITRKYKTSVPKHDLSRLINVLDVVHDLCSISLSNKHLFQEPLLENIDDISNSEIKKNYIVHLKQKVLPTLAKLGINGIVNSKLYDLIAIAPYLFVPQKTSATIEEFGLTDINSIRVKFTSMHAKCAALISDRNILNQEYEHLSSISKNENLNAQNTFSNLVIYSQILKSNMVLLTLVVEDILSLSEPIFSSYLQVLRTASLS